MAKSFAVSVSTQAPLETDGTPLPFGCVVKALSSNSDPIFIGLSSPAANGIELTAGDSWYIPPSFASDTSKLLAYSASTSGLRVAVL